MSRHILLALILVTTGNFASCPSLAAPVYQVTDLGVLPGGVSSTATSVDSTGEVVGYTTFSDGSTQAFYWTQSGGMVGLGGTNSKAFGVNNGNVVGVTGSTGQAFRWTQISGVVLLDTASPGQANGINSSGEVIGSRNLTSTNHRAVTWSSSNTISNPFPLINLTGTAINDLGHYVGVSNNIGGYYNDGISSTRLNLGTFLPTSLSNTDLAGGAVSQIAAFENISTLTITSIGTLPGDTISNALGIDPLGTTIVGVSQGHGGFFYDIATNDLESLNSLIDPSESGWSILSGNGIANAPISGSTMIAGQGDFGGIQHAVLLTVPEVSSTILAGLGSVCLLVITRRSIISHINTSGRR